MSDARALPQWTEGKPDKPGAYFGCSTLPSRLSKPPSLYTFDGSVFQHWTGWYDNGVTHWMATDLPDPGSPPRPATED